MKKDLKYFLIAVIPVFLSIFLSDSLFAKMQEKKEKSLKEMAVLTRRILEEEKRIKEIVKLDQKNKEEERRKKIQEIKNRISTLEKQNSTFRKEKIISQNKKVAIPAPEKKVQTNEKIILKVKSRTTSAS
jgi:vacuolar-type H+-ATPase catalytic subunit A/Vma1